MKANSRDQPLTHPVHPPSASKSKNRKQDTVDRRLKTVDGLPSSAQFTATDAVSTSAYAKKILKLLPARRAALLSYRQLSHSSFTMLSWPSRVVERRLFASTYIRMQHLYSTRRRDLTVIPRGPLPVQVLQCS